MLLVLLLSATGLLLVGWLVFTLESLREREPRAPWVGTAGLLGCVLAGSGAVFFEGLRIALGLLYLVLLMGGVALLIPARANPHARRGAAGHAVGEITRADERDTVFARNRSLPQGSEIYRRYYQAHPEREKRDAERRARGGPVGRIATIDGGYRPNVAMIQANFGLPAMLGPQAEPAPTAESLPAGLDPQRATAIVKGFAGRLGADLVGICRVHPQWTYSHRGEIFYGNWQDWGASIPEPLPFAVVVGTEMDSAGTAAGPHSPTLVESSFNYAKGAFITTLLAGWFASMGYRSAAQHSRHYDLNLVPLAIDAGLGEPGRLGYLISDRYGPRVRLFAVTTDMELVPNRPVDLGVDRFCRSCLKCADACPSRSIPRGGKTVVNGVEKWKLDAESCFDYWGKTGTDCSVCMAACPFSRPDRPLHRLVRCAIRHSVLARRVFPLLDNWVYGRRWRPRPAPEWCTRPPT
jgi:reductive dehalogenase